MRRKLDQARVLVYSHDTFGLGHLRRCRRIAHALVERFEGLSVLLLSGSPVIGSFDFPARVDFVRLPGVTKERSGEYTSHSLEMDVAEVLALRAALIEQTARTFAPDLMLVDKEPLGLRGEVAATLALLRGTGARLVLGLRDVLDEPGALAEEWSRKQVLPALERYYDHVLVFGREEVYDPLAGIALPAAVRDRVRFTGYLGGDRARDPDPGPVADGPGGPRLLVTAGGGGDGEEMVDWVLRAREQCGALPLPALIVLGPFMPARAREDFERRARSLPDVTVIAFAAGLERLIAASTAVVAMGGYNTFCELLACDRPALIVPRRVPRLEQEIRARRASELGLVRVLSDRGGREAGRMAAALRELVGQPRPSAAMPAGLLDGLEQTAELFGEWLRGT